MVQLGRLEELPPGTMAEVRAAGRTVLVCHVDQGVYAIDGICPHRGAPLAHGALHEHTVVCPWHGWQFDCRTGTGDLADVQAHTVVVRDGLVYLDAGTA